MLTTIVPFGADAGRDSEVVRDDVAERDAKLVRRMLGGDPRAVDEFCAFYLPRVHRFVVARVRHPADATEIVNAVVSNAVRRIETYRGDATLLAWLLAISRREIARRYAAASRGLRVLQYSGDDALRRVVEGLEGPIEHEPEQAARREELASSVHRCLSALPAHYADALNAMYVEGVGSRSLGERLGLSDDAAQSLLARARRAFREVWRAELGREVDDGEGNGTNP
jgi:RNA polymerase sigma-70 factor (ECF subfamily)